MNAKLQECRSSGALMQNTIESTRMSLLRSSDAKYNLIYKNIAPPELKAKNHIILNSKRHQDVKVDFGIRMKIIRMKKSSHGIHRKTAGQYKYSIIFQAVYL